MTQVAGRHAAWDCRPVKPGRTLPAGTAGYGNLTRAGEATDVLAAGERSWSLRAGSLQARSLRPWKLSGKLLSRKLRARKLRRWELRRWAERPRVRLFGEGSAAWT